MNHTLKKCSQNSAFSASREITEGVDIAAYEGDSNRNLKENKERLISNGRAIKWQVIGLI